LTDADTYLQLSVEGMTKDLTSGQEKPLWPLTSYGPGKYQPQLVGGLDESSEELRVRAVAALTSDTTNDYVRFPVFTARS
jgi:nucleoporin NUP42